MPLPLPDAYPILGKTTTVCDCDRIDTASYGNQLSLLPPLGWQGIAPITPSLCELQCFHMRMGTKPFYVNMYGGGHAQLPVSTTL